MITRTASSPPSAEGALFTGISVASGLLAATTALVGLLTTMFSVFIPSGANNKMIALSAALIWIFIGIVLAYNSIKPLQRVTTLVVQAVLAFIAVSAAIEVFLSVQGSHFFIENWFVALGKVIIGPASSFISPVAAGLAVPASLALILVIGEFRSVKGSRHVPDLISCLGWIITIISFTFVLSYFFGNPLLYGTQYIPIAFFSALAAFFNGIALIAAAGPRALPIRYAMGNSTRASLLRIFIPLVAGIVFIENIGFAGLSSWFNIHDAVILSTSLILFVLITAVVVGRASGKLGLALDRAEQELVRKNEDLGAANEELTATQEELRQTNDELVAHEEQLTATNEALQSLNEELTATEEELRQTIDDLTTTEKNLRESETRLRRFYESGLIGVIYWNMNGEITDANDKFLTMVGYTREDLAGGRIDWIHMTPSEFQHLDEESAKELTSTGVNAKPFEKQYFRKDGTRIPILIAGAMLDERRSEGVAFVLDITERKKAEKALQESESRLRFALETSHTGAWDLDLVDHTAFRSQEHDRIFGYPKMLPQWTYEMFLEHVIPEHRAMVDEKFQLAVKNQGDWSFECKIQRGDGEIRWIWAAGRHRAGASGSMTRMAGIIQDITDRKKAEYELIKRNEDLNALNEELTMTEEELHQTIEELSRREQELSKALIEKEVLLSEIHHRVKNNLTAFISLLSLEGSTEDTPAGKLLKKDLQNRARSMALVHETLYRTNMYDEVDMNLYLTTLVNQIANSFQTAPVVRTIVDAYGVKLDIARATPAGLIVNELVTNSFKYAFPESFDPVTVRNAPPTITVRLRKTDGTYELTFSDNGVGLPDKFDIAKAQSLGLKLVNFLARHQMRANIEINSENGTEFIFRFKE